MQLLQRLVDRLEARQEERRQGRGPRSAARHLIYVHVICRHEAGFSHARWGALKPHLSAALQNAV